MTRNQNFGDLFEPGISSAHNRPALTRAGTYDNHGIAAASGKIGALVGLNAHASLWPGSASTHSSAIFGFVALIRSLDTFDGAPSPKVKALSL